ncbi:hypothetical protein L228DRAFT_280023 [Xylona heveae TC161]|uniref:Small ribosomal subunit protein mS41 n=1 Tax=Xylona heveae (strain CBS 132557 / TC161) TaxID=1328760 RepID=A0A165K176_XYLHT|nr:hypothetical protein L228DRAFT_280023 [Xylona heveae TC161]KZF26876.1 hypothetical protein L228DRAFT_280023 [Xylona heveae TC161]
MINRASQLRLFFPPTFRNLKVSTCQHVRSLHHRMPASRVPAPTPFVPDTQTFLSLIGRNLSKHASKLPSWEALFSLSSPQLRELGIEPARDRRYLLRWCEKFRKGQYGVGGDLQNVVEGKAEVRVVEVPVPIKSQSTGDAAASATGSAGKRKIVVNLPYGESEPSIPAESLQPIRFMKVHGASQVKGPHVSPVKGTQGTVATISVIEGLWENKRGRKIDGGERRRAEVRAKRQAEERRTTRG